MSADPPHKPDTTKFINKKLVKAPASVLTMTLEYNPRTKQDYILKVALIGGF